MGETASLNIIKQTGNSETVVTKSRFIGYITPVKDASEAESVINTLRKKYNDARHNPWAYIVMEGDLLNKKCSDDGEPSQTAGKPILSVLEGAHLVNAVCVVTRYFGGVLLGTGGLVRAYSDAAAKALETIPVIPIRPGRNLEILCEYADEGTVRRMLESREYVITNSCYAEKVTLSVLGPEEAGERLSLEITDRTGGRASVTMGDTEYI